MIASSQLMRVIPDDSLIELISTLNAILDDPEAHPIPNSLAACRVALERAMDEVSRRSTAGAP